MTLVKSNNGYYSAIPSLIDSLFSNNWSDWNDCYLGNRKSVPAVNISENENEFLIEVAAPGMQKDDFNVKVENDVLTISSEIKDDKKEKGQNNYSRREFDYNSFNRTFTISKNTLDSDKIEAKYQDGILRLVLPKKEEAKPKPAREIKIA